VTAVSAGPGSRAAKRRASLGALAVALVLAAGGGCGTIDGGAAHAGEAALVPPDRAYRLWFLAPPWQLVSTDAQRAELRVAVGADDPRSGGTAREVIGLTVEAVAGVSPDALLASRIQQGLAAGSVLTVVPRTVPLASPAVGEEAAFGDGVVLQRVVTASLADGRAVVLTFRAGIPLEADADVTGMIGEFEPRPPVGP
jgi:hypothetical protein